MALKYEVVSLDDLDSQFHDLYKQVEDKFVLDVEGVKPLAEFNKVYGSLEKERNDHRAIKQKLSAYGDLEPESIQTQLARIAELEELAKGSAIDDKKLEDMVSARLNAKLQPVEAEKNQLAKKAAELEALVNDFQSKEQARRMNDEFSTKIDAAKIDPKFKELVMYKAREIFTEMEDGKILTKDGINSVTGFMPMEVWLTEQQAVNPHWWGETFGGGSQGTKQNYRGSNPFVNGTATEQGELVRTNPELAKKLAVAANHPMAAYI